MFTALEIQLIRSSLTTKSDGEIAALLERELDEVHAEINRITGGGAAARSKAIQEAREAVFSKQRELEEKKRQQELDKEKRKRIADERKKLRDEEQAKKQKELKEKSFRISREEQRRQEKMKRESRAKLPTRDLHLDQLISVKIDSKTHVLVKPGTNIEKIKQQYQRAPVSKETFK